MKELDFLKFDLDLVKGMDVKISRRHKEGESYAAMYAEYWEAVKNYDDRMDSDYMPFQRLIAFGLALDSAITNEYMEILGWNYNAKTDTWEAPAVDAPEQQKEAKEAS